MIATICWVLLTGFAAINAHAATMPQPYLDLLAHEDYMGVIALSDAELAAHTTPRDAHARASCLALEHRVRIDFFSHIDPVAAKRQFAQRALECRREHRKNAHDKAQIAWLQARLLNLLLKGGEHKQALALFADAQIRLKANRTRIAAADYAIAAMALGDVAFARHDLDDAYVWSQIAADATRNGDAYARMVRAHALIFECYYLGRLSRFAQAQRVGMQAVELAGRLFGTPSVTRSDALIILGQVQYFANRFAMARTTLAQAIAEERQLGARARARLASSLGMWGNLQRRIGDYARGRAALTEAISIERAHPVSGNNNLDSKLNNLAALEIEAGHCDAAIAPLREALAIATRRDGPDSIWSIAKLSNLGLCELQAGQIQPARIDLNKSFAIALRNFDKSNAQLAEPELNLARLDLAEHEYASATRRLRHALALLPADADVMVALRVVIERTLARSLHFAQHDDEAFQHALAAETSRQHLLRGFANALDENEGLDLHNTLSGGLDQALALAAAHPDRVWTQRTWKLEIGSRALITRLVAARLKAVRNRTDPASVALWRQWQTANAAYAAAVHAAESRTANSASLQVPRDALDQAERALAARFPGLRKTVPDFAALRAAVPAGSALVGFTLGRSDPWSGNYAGQRKLPPHYYAFHLTAMGEPTITDLGDAYAISAAIRDWTVALRNPARPLDAVNALGSDVRKKIWDPLALPQHLNHIFIVPDGQVYRVAWLALPLVGGALVETGPVPQLLDSEADVVSASHAVPDAAQRALLVGAIPADASDVGSCGDSLRALPGARRELDGLRTLWNASSDHDALVYLTGRAAKKTAVLAALPQSSIVHFATHAIESDSDCNQGAIATRGIRISTSAVAASTPGIAESGLLLAADPQAAANDRNSVLTAAEIAALRLDAVNSVTLAACDTGLGPITVDEGVFGLARAFRLAGARSVVMSLWSVDDDATAQLMQRMYRARWADHAAPADALALAARDTLHARRAAGKNLHPYYWAGFVVTDSGH